MKKLLVAATGAAALLVASSFPALAEDVTGSIKSIDVAAGLVGLDNGQVYHLPTTVVLADFKVGQKVKITFDAAAGQTMNASTITAADLATPSSPGPAGAMAGPTNNAGAPRD